jgi:dTDP-4-amino-4,6-dideoxygalactose transaminase
MIPFLDLQAQYRAIGPELETAALDVLRGGEYILGSRVATFEENFARYCGAMEAVALNSGTSALHLALLGLDIGAGDEVITVAMTFVATVAAIRYANATPILVDVSPDTWTMDPEAMEKAITPRTKAIIPVHLHGRLCDMTTIVAIADRHGIPIIEDAAQAHGAEFNGQKAGTYGVIGCFSFYPGKNLGACGEGGGVVTNWPRLAQAIRKLRDWGQATKYDHELHGFNYRMDAIQGAVLDVKLRRLDDWTRERRAAARLYDEKLAGSGVQTPTPPVDREHVYHVYAIRSTSRDLTQRSLKEAGVMTSIHYPRPVHLQRAYADLGYHAGDFPVSEKLCDETLSLPIFPELTGEQIDYVCGALREIAGRGQRNAKAA